MVDQDVMHTIQTFFKTRKLPHGLNHTYICLIPKKPCCDTLMDYKPISLTSVVYKLITKILATRLKEKLQQFISPTWGAFFVGKQICDNVVIARDMTHFIRTNRNSKKLFALKLDLSKAFNHLEWYFLKSTLLTMGLSKSNWVLIHECISTPTNSVLLNGQLKGQFSSSRGNQ